jgi:hypothetical protein
VLAPTYVASGVGGKPTVQFDSVNVQVLNGAGSTASVNGAGNLVVGYDQTPGTQTGSHNLVLGTGQTFTSYGGLVGGLSNSVTGPYGTAFGTANKVPGADAFAAGNNNTASGTASSVLGGYKNVAKSNYSTISGGCANLTGSGGASVVALCSDSAGHPANFASISGGSANRATGVSSSLSGGQLNLTADTFGFGPSSITDVMQLNPSGASPTTSLAFISSRVVHFTDPRTMAHLTGQIGLSHSTGTHVDAVLGVCWQPAAGGALTLVSHVQPAIDSNTFTTVVQSVSGVVNGLAPGDYRVGLCASDESANVQHGFSTGTLVLGESNTAPPPAVPTAAATARTSSKRR